MTDLTDRMRTMAAAISAEDFTAWRIYENETQDRIIRDVQAILLEAAAELEKPIEVRLGTAMEIIQALPSEAARVAPEKTVPRRPAISDLSGAAWIDPGVPDLPTQPLSKNACPKCDSRATKTVHALGKRLELECPVCGTRWQRT